MHKFSMLFLLVTGISVVNAAHGQKLDSMIWGMAGKNAQRTGYSPNPGPTKSPVILWEGVSGMPESIFDMPPSIDDEGNLYVDMGSSWRHPQEDRYDGVISFDSQGKERWRFINTEGNNYGLSIPALTEQHSVVMGFRDGVFRCFDRGTGEIRWEQRLGARNIIAACVLDGAGNIYASVTSDGNGLYRLASDTGKILWHHPFAGGTSSSPALSQDAKTVYIANDTEEEGENGLLAFDAESGTLKWAISPYRGTFFDWTSPMIGKDGTIYLQDEKDCTLSAIQDQGENALLKWSYTPETQGSNTTRFPAMDEDTIYLPAIGNDPTFTALTLEGTPKWQYGFLGFVEFSNVIVNDEAVYIAAIIPEGGASWVYAFNKTNGVLLWRKQLTHPDAEIGGLTLGKDGVLYVCTSGTFAHRSQAVIVALK